MNFTNRGFPAGNPIANALVVVVGVLAIVASLVLGFFAFLVLAFFVTVFAAIVGIRLWWFRRKMRRAAGSAPQTQAARVDVIEGEFRVVAPDRDGPDEVKERDRAP